MNDTVRRSPGPCVLYDDRPACVGCGDCRCDLDPDKVCDNCMQCVTGGADFRAVRVDGVVLDEDGPGVSRGCGP